MNTANNPGHGQPIFGIWDIFPPVERHVHSPSVVELPNQDLLACWFEGSGERTADDVVIMGSRKKAGKNVWSKPFLLANSFDFPDNNPVLFLDPRGVLWLIWTMVIANRWETSLLKVRTSDEYEGDGAPEWGWQREVILKPGDRFGDTVRNSLQVIGGANHGKRYMDWKDRILPRAYDKFQRRLGWQTRNQPLVVNEKTMLLPLYSDGYGFSMLAMTEDWGRSWRTSAPIVGAGNVQPSLVQAADGTLVAYMRDNGPPPKRVQQSTSRDGGQTWSPVRACGMPNPGSSCVVLGMKDGSWLMVNNDHEWDRCSLLVSLSDNEGETWEIGRYLENSREDEHPVRSHYPTVIQGGDGMLHAVYSHHGRGGGNGKTIRYARFNQCWIRDGGGEGGM